MARRQGRRGQAALESMMMMAFMLLLIFGVMHLVMFAVTRYMVNYAAVVGNSPTAAARAVMDNLNWLASEGGTPNVQVTYGYRGGSGGYIVRTWVPFGMPIYEYIEPQGMLIESFAAVTTQNNPPSGGDNGE